MSPAGIGREGMLQADPQPDASAPDAVGAVPGTGVPGGTGTVNLDAPPPTPRSKEPIRLSSLVKAPVKIHDVSPVYPTVAVAAHVEGIVIIEAVIGTSGEVVNAKVLRSNPLLDDAALSAVRQWRYTPTLLGGVPQAVILTVTVTFSLK